MYVCRSLQKGALLYIYIYIYIHTRARTHAHTHTHTNTHEEKHKVAVHGDPRKRKAYIQSGAASFPKGIVNDTISTPVPCRLRHDTFHLGLAESGGTRKRMGGEVKGKKANGGGSQQSCPVSDTVYPALLPLMRLLRLLAAD